MSLTAELKAWALARGADTIGIASAAAFEAKVPNLQKPSETAAGMHSLIAFTVHLLNGCMASHDIVTQSINSHVCIDLVEKIQYEMCDWLEERGHLGIPSPTEYSDMNMQKSAAGVLDFKWVAEEAGIGTVGLNQNFLTPEHGSRVYLGVVLTDAEMQPDPMLQKHVCPGLACGRCAAICPTDAIPRQADKGAHVSAYRWLNKKLCSLGAQRVGVRSMFLNLEELVKHQDRIDPAKVIDSTYMRDFWQSLNLKVGSFGACFECFYICPIGPHYKKLIKTDSRSQDLPKGAVKHVKTEAKLTVLHVGPPASRRHEYERDKEIEHLVSA